MLARPQPTAKWSILYITTHSVGCAPVVGGGHLLHRSVQTAQSTENIHHNLQLTSSSDAHLNAASLFTSYLMHWCSHSQLEFFLSTCIVERPRG